jgi:hypothetical protein
MAAPAFTPPLSEGNITMKTDTTKKSPTPQDEATEIMAPNTDDDPLPGRKPSAAFGAALRAVAEMEIERR